MIVLHIKNKTFSSPLGHFLGGDRLSIFTVSGNAKLRFGFVKPPRVVHRLPNLHGFEFRVTDCKFVLDMCLADPDLKALIDSVLVGVAGHSYGALTVQAISGQSKGTRQADPRIKAAIAFSPTAMSQAAASSMKAVNIPFFCITGVHDGHVTIKNETESLRLGVEPAKRKLVYRGLPPGKREQLVLANADHMSFAGEKLFNTPLKYSRDVTHTAAQEGKIWEKISRVTTLFWQTHLGKNVSANDVKKYKENLPSGLDKEDEYTVD